MGHSGKELADLILADIDHCPAETDIYSVTPEYWAGWALAYYQWYTAQDFSEICSGEMTFERILRMYNPLHEADLSKFVEVVATKALQGRVFKIAYTNETCFLGVKMPLIAWKAIPSGARVTPDGVWGNDATKILPGTLVQMSAKSSSA